MGVIENCVDVINAQGAKFKVGSLEHGICKILTSLAQSNENYAEIIAQDLEVEEMSIKAASKKLYDYASKNRNGSSFCMTDDLAVELVKKFYKLPNVSDSQGDRESQGNKGETAVKAKRINLADFM